MNAWERFCRNAGLMIYHLRQPVEKPPSHRQVLREDVEQTQVSDRMILRRTTIEEVEIRSSDEGNSSGFSNGQEASDTPKD